MLKRCILPLFLLCICLVPALAIEDLTSEDYITPAYGRHLSGNYYYANDGAYWRVVGDTFEANGVFNVYSDIGKSLITAGIEINSAFAGTIYLCVADSVSTTGNCEYVGRYTDTGNYDYFLGNWDFEDRQIVGGKKYMYIRNVLDVGGSQDSKRYTLYYNPEEVWNKKRAISVSSDYNLSKGYVQIVLNNTILDELNAYDIAYDNSGNSIAGTYSSLLFMNSAGTRAYPYYIHTHRGGYYNHDQNLTNETIIHIYIDDNPDGTSKGLLMYYNTIYADVNEGLFWNTTNPDTNNNPFLFQQIFDDIRWSSSTVNFLYNINESLEIKHANLTWDEYDSSFYRFTFDGAKDLFSFKPKLNISSVVVEAPTFEGSYHIYADLGWEVFESYKQYSTQDLILGNSVGGHVLLNNYFYDIQTASGRPTYNYSETFFLFKSTMALGGWGLSYSAIATGLGDVGDKSTPTVFQMNDTLYLISGEISGVFNGYNWTGSTWQADSNIVSGLGNVGIKSAPTVFQMNDTLYLISGEGSGVFNGYNWTGSTWQADSNIVSGLGDVGDDSTPTVFQMNDTLYLISGEYDGVFNGYNWTGSTWQADSNIVSGLGDVGIYSAPTVFQMNDTLYLISGENSGVFNGYNWTGSTWQASNIVFGFGDVGTYSAPTVFQMNDTLYLISGEILGVFKGFIWTYEIGIYLGDDVKLGETETEFTEFSLRATESVSGSGQVYIYGIGNLPVIVEDGVGVDIYESVQTADYPTTVISVYDFGDTNINDIFISAYLTTNENGIFSCSLSTGENIDTILIPSEDYPVTYDMILTYTLEDVNFFNETNITNLTYSCSFVSDSGTYSTENRTINFLDERINLSNIAPTNYKLKVTPFVDNTMSLEYNYTGNTSVYIYTKKLNCAKLYNDKCIQYNEGNTKSSKLYTSPNTINFNFEADYGECYIVYYIFNSPTNALSLTYRIYCISESDSDYTIPDPPPLTHIDWNDTDLTEDEEYMRQKFWDNPLYFVSSMIFQLFVVPNLGTTEENIFLLVFTFVWNFYFIAIMIGLSAHLMFREFKISLICGFIALYAFTYMGWCPLYSTAFLTLLAVAGVYSYMRYAG